MADCVSIADITKETVHLVSTCSENDIKTIHVTKTVVEVVNLAEAGDVDKNQVIRDIDGSLDIIKGSLEIGMFAFPEAAPFLAIAAGVCTFIQKGLSFLPHDDPVMLKINELNEKLDELDKKTKVQFDDMKIFITENNFNLEIVSEIATLKKFVLNFLKYGTPETIESLQNAYEQNSTLNIAYTLASLLDQRATNPLTIALEKEEWKSKETIDKWEKTVKVLFGDLMFIEAFSHALIRNASTYNWRRIISQAEKIQTWFNQWRVYYMNMNSDHLWNELKDLFKPNCLEKGLEKYRSPYGGNQEWAEGFKNLINDYYKRCYLIDDAFYIIFFDHSYGGKSFDLYCSEPDTRIIMSLGEGRVDAVIYRSRTGNRLTKNDDEDAKKEIEKLATNVNNSDIANFFNWRHEWLRKDRFYFITARDEYPAIRYANHHEHELGPGAWADINGFYGQWMVIGHP